MGNLREDTKLALMNISIVKFKDKWREEYRKMISEMQFDGWNQGDWTTLTTVEIGDVVGGCKIRTLRQKRILHKAGEFIK